MTQKWLGIASLLLALAVIAGAFGAHALKARLDPYLLSVWEKAVFYHFVHAIGLFLVGILFHTAYISEGIHRLVSLLLVGGIVVFSGSLYILAVTGIKWLGAITPIGGTAFIIAWLCLAWAGFKR